MANIKSAKKRARQAVKRAETNRARVSRIRTFVKKVESAIASGDKSAAEAALKAAEPEVGRGVSRGVLHRNTAARKISRLTHRVRAMGATA
jgi:small subunit ribosomal protein S20